MQAIVKAVVACSFSNVQLWFVTKGVNELENLYAPQLQYATVCRLLRSIALEHPGIKAKSIDLPIQGDSIDLLYKDICCPDQEDNIVYRKGQRYVERLQQYTPAKILKGNVIINGSKTYVVTGGLSGLGFAISQWLIKQGARHLVLVSRSGNIKDIAAYKKLLQTGADIQIKKADVALLSDMDEIFNRLTHPLGGVIHAAGLVNAASFTNQTWDEFNNVLKPKVHGAWNLHLLTKDREHDFFICISSISSQIGSVKLSSYVAANAFLDAIAHFRNNCHLPCTSINLGPVAEIGMVVKNNDIFDPAVLSKVGLNLLSPINVINAVRHVLSHGITQLTLADTDIERIRQTMGTQNSFFDDLKISKESNIEDLNFNEFDERDSMPIHQQLQFLANKVLEIPEHDINKNLFDSGLDSLMVIELVKHIKKRFKINFEPVLIYANPTLNQLADIVLQLHSKQLAPII